MRKWIIIAVVLLVVVLLGAVWLGTGIQSSMAPADMSVGAPPTASPPDNADDETIGDAEPEQNQ